MKNCVILFVILNVALYTSAFQLVVEKKEDPKDVKINNNIEAESNQNLPIDNLCAKLNCLSGQQCVLIDNEPQCACIEDCDLNDIDRLMVCSTSNVTFESECHFYREKCWCAMDDNKCRERSSIKDNIDYFGRCQSVDKCSDEEKNIFPRRMQLWLDEVLIELSQRKDIDERKYGHLVNLAKKTKKENIEKYWTYGVIFEFCQLDKSHDGVLSMDEMKELVVPIKALENCIQPFLADCDQSKDGKIDEVEWGKCLDLSEDDIKLLRQACLA